MEGLQAICPEQIVAAQEDSSPNLLKGNRLHRGIDAMRHLQALILQVERPKIPLHMLENKFDKV